MQHTNSACTYSHLVLGQQQLVAFQSKKQEAADGFGMAVECRQMKGRVSFLRSLQGDRELRAHETLLEHATCVPVKPTYKMQSLWKKAMLLDQLRVIASV